MYVCVQVSECVCEPVYKKNSMCGVGAGSPPRGCLCSGGWPTPMPEQSICNHLPGKGAKPGVPRIMRSEAEESMILKTTNVTHQNIVSNKTPKK